MDRLSADRASRFHFTSSEEAAEERIFAWRQGFRRTKIKDGQSPTKESSVKSHQM